MTDFFDLLLRRRSVRRYTDEAVPREQLEQIVRAGLLSPTGRNRREWEFVVVEDRETLEQLATARSGGAAKMLAGAAAAIVVFADSTATDVWCEDCSIAMSNMHLMAAELGLGSCWIQGRLRTAKDGRTTNELVRELLGAPEGLELEAVLSVGVPAQCPAARTEDDADMTKVHWERF